MPMCSSAKQAQPALTPGKKLFAQAGLIRKRRHSRWLKYGSAQTNFFLPHRAPCAMSLAELRGVIIAWCSTVHDCVAMSD